MDRLKAADAGSVSIQDIQPRKHLADIDEKSDSIDPTPGSGTQRSSSLDMAKPYDEKHGSNPPSTATSTARTFLDDESPITYHYLTFATPLPFPSPPPLALDAPPPPPPDLKKFTDPFLWSPTRKRLTVYLACVATCMAAFIAGAYSPPMAAMAADFHVSSVVATLGLTSFCVGFAVMPMVLAPISEIQGRYPIFVVSGIFFEGMLVCCALTPSVAGMIVARFLVGCGSSVFSSMVGGVISDLYHTAERNTPMALFSGSSLFGTGLGPLVSGFVAQHLHWRWVFWVQVLACGPVVLAVTVFFNESRGSVLLSRKAAALNRWYEAREAAGFVGLDMPSVAGEGGPTSQRVRWIVKSDEERESLVKMIKISVYRPLHLLTTEPVVFFFSLWISFAWAVLYLTFGALPLIFRTSHGFNVQQCGAVFASMCVGALLATYLAIAQDRHSARFGRFLRRTFLRSPPPSSSSPAAPAPYDPEIRLYFACLHSLLLPIGLLWLGFTQPRHIHWIVPCIGVVLATMGIYAIYLATFNYLADVYHRYASSALAAQSFCRNLLGAVFPLISNPLFVRLGFQGGCGLLGGIGFVLSLVPWALVLYGPAIRKRSKVASEIM